MRLETHYVRLYDEKEEFLSRDAKQSQAQDGIRRICLSSISRQSAAVQEELTPNASLDQVRVPGEVQR